MREKIAKIEFEMKRKWHGSRPKRQRQDRNARRESRISKKGFFVGYLETVAEDMQTNQNAQVMYRDLCRVNLVLAMQEINLCFCDAGRVITGQHGCTMLLLNKFDREPSNWTTVATYALERIGRDGIRTRYGTFSPDPKRGPTSLFKKFCDAPMGEMAMIAQDFVYDSLALERAKVRTALQGPLREFFPQVLCEEISGYWMPDDRLLFWGLYVRKFMDANPQALDLETRELVEEAIVRTSFLIVSL